jgi:hypothetical protein
MGHRAVFLLGALALVTGCAGVRTGPVSGVHDLLDGQSYRLVVRTDKPEMDRIVAELAYASFKRYLPLTGSPQAEGTVEVYFTTSFAASGEPIAEGTGWGWRSGSTPVPSGAGAGGTAPRTYYDGVMLVVIKDAAGEKLWSGEYRHKGRWSLASASPEAVARISVKKMTEALRQTVMRVRPEAGRSPGGKGAP